ncbi:hypothetical protein ACJIZ3_019518 [Penstemon smallii]|uniref:Uncharacterized protein n=1 Tax=Penstemon smallii TaxID=265156 RepID=A0ABD3T253_9LAMI
MGPHPRRESRKRGTNLIIFAANYKKKRIFFAIFQIQEPSVGEAKMRHLMWVGRCMLAQIFHDDPKIRTKRSHLRGSLTSKVTHQVGSSRRRKQGP